MIFFFYFDLNIHLELWKGGALRIKIQPLQVPRY